MPAIEKVLIMLAFGLGLAVNLKLLILARKRRIGDRWQRATTKLGRELVSSETGIRSVSAIWENSERCICVRYSSDETKEKVISDYGGWYEGYRLTFVFQDRPNVFLSQRT